MRRTSCATCFSSSVFAGDDLLRRRKLPLQRRELLRLIGEALLQIGSKLREALVLRAETFCLLRCVRELVPELGRRCRTTGGGASTVAVATAPAVTGGAATETGGARPAPNPVAKPYSVFSRPPCWVASAWAITSGRVKPRSTTIFPSGLPVACWSASATASCSLADQAALHEQRAEGFLSRSSHCRRLKSAETAHPA